MISVLLLKNMDLRVLGHELQRNRPRSEEVASLGSVGPDLLFLKAEPFLDVNWNILTLQLRIFGLPKVL